jgi:hypothetical protein
MSLGVVLSSDPSSSVISMYINPCLPLYGNAVITGLIILLSLKVAISGTERWNKDLSFSLDMAITPLVFSFIGIVLFKIVEFVKL